MSDQNVQEALRTLRDSGLLSGDQDGPPPPQPRYSASEAKQLAKFEQFPSDITVIARMAPGNPPTGKRFPRMLYRAQQLSNGKWATGCEVPRRVPGENENDWNRRVEAANRFAESCQLVVRDEVEYSRAHESGWRDSSLDALSFQSTRAETISQEAAERAYRDRNMSDAAKAEVAAVEAEHFGHLAEIPEKPRRRKSA